MQITLQITINKVKGFNHLVFISGNGPMAYKCTYDGKTSFSYNITDNGKCPSMWFNNGKYPITPKEAPYPSSVFTGSGSANTVYPNNAYYYARCVLGDRNTPYPWCAQDSGEGQGKWTATFTNPDFRGGFLAFAFATTPIHFRGVWYTNTSTISIKIFSNGRVLYDYTGFVKSELFNNIVDPTDVNNPLYLNFANPKTMESVRYTPIFDLSVLRHNSEYVRRSYSKEQEVTTDLNFTGKVKVPNPLEPDEASTKGYVDSQKSQIINDIATQNPTLEKLHKIEWTLEALSDSVTNQPPSSLGLSFCQFLDANQMPLQLVAFSLDEDTKITNFNNAYLMGKYWTAYFAPTTTNNLTSAKWTTAAARQMLKTLTSEDEDYLNAYDYIIKMKIQIDNVVSVNYVPISIFNYQKVKSPSTGATGITSGQNLSTYGGEQIRIWIDDEDSLHLFKLHIKNMIFSTYVWAGGNGYGTFRVRVSSILNDKYVDFRHVFNQYTQDNQTNPITNNSRASAAYMVSLNLVRDSTYNKKTISPSITGLLLNHKTPILYWREYDDTLQEFVFKERTYAEANADVPT